MANINSYILTKAPSMSLCYQKPQQFHENNKFSNSSSSSSSLSSLNSHESESRLKSIDQEFRSIKSQIAKNESILLRENNKLNSNNSQIERHGIK